MGIFQDANSLLKLENIIHTVPVTVCVEIKMVAASITSRNVQFFQVRVSKIKPSKYRNRNMKEGCVTCQTGLISLKEIIVGVYTVRQFINLGLLYCHTH